MWHSSNSKRDVKFDRQTALIVVDVQNDFANPAGSLFVPGGDAIIQPINALCDRVRAAGGLVVYTQDWHPEKTPHFRDQGGSWPVHCVRGTWGAELVEGLHVSGPIVRKGTGGEDGYSGFSFRDPESGATGRTELHGILEQHGIEWVIVVGLALDVCVKETALDARRLGYTTAIVKHAARAVDPARTEQTLKELKAAGVRLQ